MDKKILFNLLKKETKGELIKLLEAACCEMNASQTRRVFGHVVEKAKPKKAEGKKVQKEVNKFYKDSLAGKYYEPFDINSKNFMDMPEETEEWFENLNDHLLSSTQLSKQNDHLAAVDCFSLLYELIEKVENGEDIIFAHEYGMWMLPGDEKVYIKAYVLSLAATKSPEEYAKMTISIIRRDSYESFCNKVYAKVIRAANKDQQNFLRSEIERLNIRVK